jgi:hypothetical protein
MNIPLNTEELLIQGKAYPIHETYEVFRLLLKKIYKEHKNLTQFFSLLDRYVEYNRKGKLNLTQEEFLHDVINLINGNCPLTEMLEYPDAPTLDYKLPKT